MTRKRHEGRLLVILKAREAHISVSKARRRVKRRSMMDKTRRCKGAQGVQFSRLPKATMKNFLILRYAGLKREKNSQQIDYMIDLILK